MSFIEIGDDLFNTELIAAVRPIADDDDHCVIFTAGQSATDGGFLVNLSQEEVLAKLASVDRDALLQLADEMKSEIENGRDRRKVKDKDEDRDKGGDRDVVAHSAGRRTRG